MRRWLWRSGVGGRRGSWGCAPHNSRMSRYRYMRGLDIRDGNFLAEPRCHGEQVKFPTGRDSACLPVGNCRYAASQLFSYGRVTTEGVKDVFQFHVGSISPTVNTVKHEIMSYAW